MTLSDNMRAALLIMVSMAAFTVNDAFMKLAAPNLPFFQQIFMRGLLITVGLFVLSGVWGHLQFKPDRKDRLLTVVTNFGRGCRDCLFSDRTV